MRNPKRDHNNQGFVLITVMMILLLFTTLGLSILHSVQSNIQGSGNLRVDSFGFYSADGGAVSVLGYMTGYKTTTVPREVKNPKDSPFEVVIEVLSQSVRYPAGFSTLWKGSDVRENAYAPSEANARSEIELIAFVPTSRAGYGNE